MADLMQQAREAARRACLVHDERQQEVVSIPVQDWVTIAAALRDVPEDLTERHAVAELDACRLAQIAKEHRDGRLSALERVAELEAKLRAVPEGYVLVPVEPTPGMLAAVGNGADGLKHRIWRAMIAARPQGVRKRKVACAAL